MKTIIAVVLFAAVSGCATCRQHPVACAVEVGVFVAAGAVVAYEAQHRGRAPRPLNCQGYYLSQGVTAAEASTACR